MIERIIFGVALGAFLWCFLREEKIDSTTGKHPLFLLLLVVVTLGFIIASAGFGLFFGGLAVIEILVGFSIANKAFGRPSDMSLEEYKAQEEEKQKQKQIKEDLKAIKRAKKVEASQRRIEWYCGLTLSGILIYSVVTNISWNSANLHKANIQPVPVVVDDTSTKVSRNIKANPTRATENTGKLVIPSWHYKAWRVASVNNHVMINATNSENGNFLGLLRQLNDCNNRSIMLSLKADLADHADIYGENVNLRFISGNKVITTAQAKVTLIKTLFQSQYGQEIEYAITPIPQKLLLAFKQQRNIQVEVNDSLQFEDGISLYGAQFDLTGFSATYLKANEYCLGNI